MELFGWGFRGLNFHWQEYRNYTWAEVAGKLMVVEYQELDELLALQYGINVNICSTTTNSNDD